MGGGQNHTQAFIEALAKACGVTTLTPPAAKGRKVPHGKPFTFDRSKVKPSKPAPVEIRGDVKVRRFEMGASGLYTDDFMRKCGYEVARNPGNNGFRVKEIGSKGRPRDMSRAAFIEFLNGLRKKRGLEPVTRSAA